MKEQLINTKMLIAGIASFSAIIIAAMFIAAGVV
jgi:hypothetical protein